MQGIRQGNFRELRELQRTLDRNQKTGYEFKGGWQAGGDNKKLTGRNLGNSIWPIWGVHKFIMDIRKRELINVGIHCNLVMPTNLL